MNYLAIDTSGKNLTILICKNGEYFTYYDSECGVSHSVSLMVELERLCEMAVYDINSSDFIAGVTGAGSFTGIRIGIATVKALCFSLKKKFLAVTSFDTIAYNKCSGKNLAVIDAGHNGYYVAGYLDGKLILSPSYVLKDQLISFSKEYTLLSFAEIQDFNCEVVSVVSGLKLAIENKKDQASDNLDLLEPLYVRKSQAEEGRK